METTPERQPAARPATVHVIHAEADLAEPDRTPNLIAPRSVARSPGAVVPGPGENGLTGERAANERERPDRYHGRGG